MPRVGGLYPGGVRRRSPELLASKFGNWVECARAILVERLVSARFVVFGMGGVFILLLFHVTNMISCINWSIITLLHFMVKTRMSGGLDWQSCASTDKEEYSFRLAAFFIITVRQFLPN